jgi:hypothetical protein
MKNLPFLGKFIIPMKQYSYDKEKLKPLLDAIVRENLDDETWRWLQEKAASAREGNIAQLNLAFAAMPRKTGKKTISISDAQAKQLGEIRSGLTINNWTTDRLCRVWLLLQVNDQDEKLYQTHIEQLFSGAEMNELVALYSALPLLAYPQVWKMRCAEGIRSNIAFVLESIMCDNPYPSENLDEAAWNQLVLKAFFTEKPVQRIIGLDERANPDLARILSDYAHERWAAGRPVHPQLWRCVGAYLNEQIFPDIQRIARSGSQTEREAAALACADSDYLPAKQLLATDPYLRAVVHDGALTWEKLSENS